MYLNKNSRRFIPQGHSEYGAWHKRLLAMGFSREKIKQIAKSQPGYEEKVDDDDIDNSQPYDDPEKQARIEFDRVKKLFDAFSLDIAEAKDYRARHENQHTVTVKKEEPSKPAVQNESIDDNDDGVIIHLRDKAKQIVPSKPLSRLFPPIGEVNVVAGQENSGKTSLLMNEVMTVTKGQGSAGLGGVNVLILSYDLRYEFLSQYLLAYQCQDNTVIVIDRPKSWEYIQKIIEKYYINAVVLDSMLDFFSTYSSIFLGEGNDFDPDKQLSWVKAFSWLMPILQNCHLSVLGVLHVPKGRFAHGLPHSSKLGGYLWNWYVLYRKGRDMQSFPMRWLAERFDNASKRTQMLYQGRERLGEIKHWFYEYGDEVDRSLLNDKVDFVPRKLVNWIWQQEDEEFGGENEHHMTGRLSAIPSGDDLIAKLINNFDTGSWLSFSKIAEKLNARDDQRKGLLMLRLREMVTAGRITEKAYRKGQYQYKLGQQ